MIPERRQNPSIISRAKVWTIDWPCLLTFCSIALLFWYCSKAKRNWKLQIFVLIKDIELSLWWNSPRYSPSEVKYPQKFSEYISEAIKKGNHRILWVGVWNIFNIKVRGKFLKISKEMDKLKLCRNNCISIERRRLFLFWGLLIKQIIEKQTKERQEQIWLWTKIQDSEFLLQTV